METQTNLDYSATDLSRVLKFPVGIIEKLFKLFSVENKINVITLLLRSYLKQNHELRPFLCCLWENKGRRRAFPRIC